MSALVKNGDLRPDARSEVSKRDTFEAILRVGISAKVATATTDANFRSASCESCPTHINLFQMNTITRSFGQSSPHNAPHEHFRSTGIRDRNQPFAGAFGFAENTCLNGASSWTIAENICLANLWDCGGFGTCSPRLGEPGGVLPSNVRSNDLDEAKRPRAGTVILDEDGTSRVLAADCKNTDTGELKCPSQLHGAIGFIFQEFGTPTGELAVLSRDEYRRLWIEAEYPEAFAARSPRTCMSSNASDPQLGCGRCLNEINQDPNVPASAERYCRCIRSKLFNTALGISVDALPTEYLDLCTVGHHVRRRQLTSLIINGTNVTELIIEWTRQRIAGGECAPFCAATGSFTRGVGTRVLAQFELSRTRPPAVPPGAPLLPPLPPLSPGGFIELYTVIVTLSTSLDIAEIDASILDSLAASFAREAGVPVSAVTVVVQSGSAVLQVSINTGSDSPDMGPEIQASVFDGIVSNGTTVLFGLPLTSFPSISLVTQRVPLPLPLPLPPQLPLRLLSSPLLPPPSSPHVSPPPAGGSTTLLLLSVGLVLLLIACSFAMLLFSRARRAKGVLVLRRTQPAEGFVAPSVGAVAAAVAAAADADRGAAVDSMSSALDTGAMSPHTSESAGSPRTEAQAVPGTLANVATGSPTATDLLQPNPVAVIHEVVQASAGRPTENAALGAASAEPGMMASDPTQAVSKAIGELSDGAKVAFGVLSDRLKIALSRSPRESANAAAPAPVPPAPVKREGLVQEAASIGAALDLEVTLGPRDAIQLGSAHFGEPDEGPLLEEARRLLQQQLATAGGLAGGSRAGSWAGSARERTGAPAVPDATLTA